jgi:hypothetical protein
VEKIIGLIDKYVPAIASKYGIVWALVAAVIIIVAVYLLYSAGWQ